MTGATFTEWHGQTLSGIVSACRELLEDTDYPTVKRWREGGGSVVGHFQVYFPEEIAHAAGCLPFKVRGAPVEPLHSDSRFGSYLCSILKTSLEIALDNSVELDMFVTHPICDAARNLAGVWGRNFPYPCQILYLPQNVNSPHATEYLTHEYDRLKRSIEDITNRKVTDDDLRSSIRTFNRNRALLRELYAIKREVPWLIEADEAYALLAVGGMIPREEHNDLLETALPLIHERQAKRRDKIRVVLAGAFCEQPPLDLIRTIGRSCYIVDDDLLVGLRWIKDDVSVDGSPLENLATAYIDHSDHSPVQHDLRKPKGPMLLERIAHAKADAAVVTAAKMCEPGLEEQVVYTHTLDQKGIPYFVSEFEENMTTLDHLEIQLETFVENLLFD